MQHLRFQTRRILKPAVVRCQEPTLFANLKTLKLMFEHFHAHYQLQDLMEHNIERQPMGTQATATYDQQ